ncbi:hypothetical protein CASFOL_017462 [Castilleja foliolosa]|uniref:RING-type domain-containing protein n=1 Tax=Castilleja foliolosa TaxID=1961234 RepID=A0ABD3DB36_9LAMI
MAHSLTQTNLEIWAASHESTISHELSILIGLIPDNLSDYYTQQIEDQDDWILQLSDLIMDSDLDEMLRRDYGTDYITSSSSDDDEEESLILEKRKPIRPDDDDDVCAVCLAIFCRDDGKTIRVLEHCGHEFHVLCI